MARPGLTSGSLWQISVITSPQAEEAVAALLERLFSQPASVYQSAETLEPVVTVFTPKPSERAHSKREALQAGLQFITDNGLDIGPGRISIRKVPRQNWSESWKKHFKPLEIGPTLLIKPSWSRRKPNPGQALVILDPGLSFGTGQHPTTEFCLRQIVAARSPDQPQSFLDIGTGSGLLAIAASKIGYDPVRAFDNDPAAVRIARANAQSNRAAQHISITRTDLTELPLQSKTKYSVIAANLIDSLLISQSDRILNRLRPDGRLILAGILTAQFPAVQKAYQTAGLTLLQSKIENEWCSATFTFA